MTLVGVLKLRVFIATHKFAIGIRNLLGKERLCAAPHEAYDCSNPLVCRFCMNIRAIESGSACTSKVNHGQVNNIVTRVTINGLLTVPSQDSQSAQGVRHSISINNIEGQY
jgi:hypothetical protein